MVPPSVGDIVLVPFPFSDLFGAKRRPALVVADAGRGDWVCLQITSQPYGDAAAISLKETDFAQGSLRRASYVRTGKLFTAHHSLFLGVVARIDAAKLSEVRQAIISLIEHGAFWEDEV